MSVSAIGSSVQNWYSVASQRRQDLQDLTSSLQSGDLKGAQHAFADLKSTFSSKTAGSTASKSGNFMEALKMLGQDLSSGNLTQAQGDLEKVKSAHHHRQHSMKTETAQNSGSTDSTSANALSSLFAQYASTALNPTLSTNLFNFSA